MFCMCFNFVLSMCVIYLIKLHFNTKLGCHLLHDAVISPCPDPFPQHIGKFEGAKFTCLGALYGPGYCHTWPEQCFPTQYAKVHSFLDRLFVQSPNFCTRFPLDTLVTLVILQNVKCEEESAVCGEDIQDWLSCACTTWLDTGHGCWSILLPHQIVRRTTVGACVTPV